MSFSRQEVNFATVQRRAFLSGFLRNFKNRVDNDYFTERSFIIIFHSLCLFDSNFQKVLHKKRPPGHLEYWNCPLLIKYLPFHEKMILYHWRPIIQIVTTQSFLERDSGNVDSSAFFGSSFVFCRRLPVLCSLFDPLRN